MSPIPLARDAGLIHFNQRPRGFMLAAGTDPLLRTLSHDRHSSTGRMEEETRKGKTMSTIPPKVSPSILQAIGNTPIVTLRKLTSEESATVFVKLEYFSPTGSYKDRMALAMIEEAEARGDLRPGMTVVEYTGGSTGSSLAFICAVKGYPFRVVSSDAFAREKLQTMRAFGAELTIVPSQGGQITPDLIPRMIEEASAIASSQKDTYWTHQMHNTDSIQGYVNIGREVLQQVDGPVHAFCGGVGTAGMLMGSHKPCVKRRVPHALLLLNPRVLR